MATKANDSPLICGLVKNLYKTTFYYIIKCTVDFTAECLILKKFNSVVRRK